jgi:hypothetical protein
MGSNELKMILLYRRLDISGQIVEKKLKKLSLYGFFNGFEIE